MVLVKSDKFGVDRWSDGDALFFVGLMGVESRNSEYGPAVCHSPTVRGILGRKTELVLPVILRESLR